MSVPSSGILLLIFQTTHPYLPPVIVLTLLIFDKISLSIIFVKRFYCVLGWDVLVLCWWNVVTCSVCFSSASNTDEEFMP